MNNGVAHNNQPPVADGELDFDLIIVGAGLVGSSLACALQALSLKVLILDRLPPAKLSPDWQQSRPISLAHSSYRLLQQIGVWQHGMQQQLALQQHATAIERVHVSEQGGLFHTQFAAQEQEVAALGYVVPAKLLQFQLSQLALQQAQFQQIKSCKDISQVAATQAASGVDVPAHVQLTYEDVNGQSICCRAGLLLGADGAQSQVCTLAGFVATQRDAGAIAVSAALQLPLAGVAYERFVAAGVLALLPRSSEQAGMVWVMSPEQAQLRQNWSHQQWNQAITQAMRGHIEATVNMQKITASYPLATKVVEQPARKRVILMGNAAHTLYPLAAQGFNLSLRDVATWAEMYASLYAEMNSNASAQWFGDEVCLRLAADYMAARRGDTGRIVRWTDHLVRCFKAPPLPGLRTGRSFGMLGLDLCGPLKRHIARQFLGAIGPVPRLMRGLPLV